MHSSAQSQCEWGEAKNANGAHHLEFWESGEFETVASSVFITSPLALLPPLSLPVPDMSLYTTDSSTGNDSVERLLSSLTAQAQDVQESLEKFVADRADVLHNQKKAIAEYEAEMFLIEMGEPKQEP